MRPARIAPLLLAVASIAIIGQAVAAQSSDPPGWSHSQDGTLETYYRMGPFLPDGDRLLMLGRRVDPYGGVSGGGDLLATRDGLDWDIVSILIPTPWTLAGLERTAAGWVAVGSTPSGPDRDTAVQQPVVWLTRDTQSWRPTAWESLSLAADGFSIQPEDVGPGLDGSPVSGEMTGLAQGSAGLVAIGRYWCEPPCSLGPDGASERPAIWRSATGESWDRVPWADGLPDGDAIGVVGDRYVIAGANGVWASTDGSAWSRLDVDTGGKPIIGIAAGPDVAVIIGVDQAIDVGRVSAWTTHDGVSWTAHDVSAVIDTYQLERVRWIDDRFAIVGSGAGLWWSTDGESWEADPIPWAGIVWDVGSLGDRAVLGGQHGIVGEVHVRSLPGR